MSTKRPGPNEYYNVFHDETDDAPGKPWVLAIEGPNTFADILDRFATAEEAERGRALLVASPNEADGSWNDLNRS